MADQPRAMTDFEIAGFLFRHPIVAENVAETKSAILTGVYDWANALPGMIPPWGTQITGDSTYGNVTIFFDTQGTGHYTAFSPLLGDINKPAYVPPPVPCSDGSMPILGVCAPDLSWLYLVAGAFAVYVGYQTFFAKR